MKVSVNWLREFTNIKLPIDELVAKIGAQIGEVEEVVDWGEQYKGIVVAKVVTCQQHPNADRLNVCLVDDGGATKGVKRDAKGLVQVVCGAPNVRKGLTVAWIPPGAIVPSTYDGEQFKLDVRPLRGVDSNGMLASPKELNIGDDHDGILIVDKPAKPGTSFAELYELDDYIIDIENKMFTHRPDCFGILGVAREVAGIQGVQFRSPDWYLQSLPLKAGKNQQIIDLKVKNGLGKLVPRFVAVAMSDVKVKKSPVIMQTYLWRLGIRPINNVVDITNFVMALTAQPLHAYDAGKLPKPSLETRLSKKGDSLRMLNGKTVSFTDDATMLITSGDVPVGIAGIMGGSDTEVDFETTSIILECASFDMYAIRRSSMQHGLFTDAVTRFNKGQSPLQNDVVITYAVGMLQKLAGAELASDVIDTAPDKSIGFWKGIDVSQTFINERLGLDLTTTQIAKILKNVEMGVTANAKKLIVSPPFWRTDLAIPEDIVEEVGRLYGYDHLPVELPRRDLTPVVADGLPGLKQSIREYLVRAGANEALTYSFVHGDLLSKVGQDTKLAFQLSNALSPDLQYYRLSMTPSLLDKVHMNRKAGFDAFALFEMGKTHQKQRIDKDGLPVEAERLALVIVPPSGKKQGAAYYDARHMLEYLLDQIGLSCDFRPLPESYDKQTAAPFEPTRAAEVVVKDTKQAIGVVGEYRAGVRKQLKLPAHIAGFELDMDALDTNNNSSYQTLSKYPATHQDISLKVPAKTAFASVSSVIDKALQVASQAHGYETTFAPTDIYQKDTSAKHLTFRISLVHHERTLVTEEVNKVLDAVAAAAKKELGAARL